jgi:hypothetical protein
MVATLPADITQRGGVMMQTMTRGNESSAATGYLSVAFELSQRWWKVGFTTGMGHRVRTRRIAAGALEPLAQAIADAKRMFGLATDAPVISCYEWSVRFLSGSPTLAPLVLVSHERFRQVAPPCGLPNMDDSFAARQIRAPASLCGSHA